MGNYHDGMFAHDGDNPDDVYYQAIFAHEAGHAVAGHVLGQPCKYVRVEETLIQSNNVAMSYRRDNARVNGILSSSRPRAAVPQSIINEAIVICAGPAAELCWCTEFDLPVRVLFGSTGDHDNIMKLFRWVMRQELDYDGGFLDRAWDGAVTLLANNWVAVKKLTTALEAGVSESCGESFTLRGRDVAAICNQVRN